ncbi:MAG: HlyC/CorC family transporter [Tidjanibacter sp.]|nr:HlyC/CorC family transporter [Tidjanibacter sp.]
MSSVIVIVIVSLVFSAFCSGMELAFTNANKLQIEIDRKRAGLFGRMLSRLADNPGQYLTTILVGNNIALVIYSSYMTILIHQLAARWGIVMPDNTVLIETLISTLIIIFIGEYTPKIVVGQNPNFYLRLLLFPVYVCYVLLYPFAKVVTWISMGLLRLFGLSVNDEKAMRSFGKVDLENLIETNVEDEQEQDTEIKIFQNALEFPDIRVRECMIPRVDVVAADREISIEELSKLFVDTAYSRIFIWEGSIDNIVGYVNSKSLFRNPQSVNEILMPVDYVPETMYVEKLLNHFTKKRSSVAVVIDEFGGTAGTISMEDVLEEIFGDIEDEHDERDLVERKVGEKEWVLSCRLEVEYLNEKYDLGIEENDEYDTLAGFIISHAEGIPPAGTTINLNKMQIKVLKSSSARLELAKVKII